MEPNSWAFIIALIILAFITITLMKKVAENILPFLIAVSLIFAIVFASPDFKKMAQSEDFQAVKDKITGFVSQKDYKSNSTNETIKEVNDGISGETGVLEEERGNSTTG